MFSQSLVFSRTLAGEILRLPEPNAFTVPTSSTIPVNKALFQLLILNWTGTYCGVRLPSNVATDQDIVANALHSYADQVRSLRKLLNALTFNRVLRLFSPDNDRGNKDKHFVYKTIFEERAEDSSPTLDHEADDLPSGQDIQQLLQVH